MAEFTEWLDYAENQLDSVCYCAKIATSSSDTQQSVKATSSHPCNNLADCRTANDLSDKCFDVNNSVSHCANGELLSVNEQLLKVIGQNVVINHELPHEDDQSQSENEIEDQDAFYEDEEEAEELMMSLRLDTETAKRNNSTRTKLCLSETVADWSVILARYKVSAIFLRTRCYANLL